MESANILSQEAPEHPMHTVDSTGDLISEHVSPSNSTVDPGPETLQLQPPPILQALSLEEVVRQVQPFLRGEVQELEFYGITDEIYKELTVEVCDGKLHNDRTGEHLFIWWPPTGLQIMGQIYWKIPSDLRPAEWPFSILGSADVRLDNGIKSPAFSHYDDMNHQRSRNSLHDWEQRFPTLVWEVAYNENSRQLARNCARFVACSSGAVRLAIGLVITFKGAPEEEERLLERVTCSFWEKTGFAASDKLGDKTANSLVRTDGRNDDDDIVPPATEYEYTIIKGNGRAYYTYKAASQTVEIYSSTPEDGHIEILQKHTLRKPADSDKDKVVFKIPYSVIVAAIKERERLRSDMYRSNQYCLAHPEEYERNLQRYSREDSERMNEDLEAYEELLRREHEGGSA